MKVGKTLEEMGIGTKPEAEKRTCRVCKLAKNAIWVDDDGECYLCRTNREYRTDRITIAAVYATIAFIPVVLVGVILWWML